MRVMHWLMTVVLPKPAGARTSTRRAAEADSIRSTMLARGTCAARDVGGLSLLVISTRAGVTDDMDAYPCY